MSIKLAGFLDNSLSNGEGIRSVVFFSGCSHRCNNCHNEAMWDKNYGDNKSIEEILDLIKSNIGIIEGVTISGGDPFEQSIELLSLCKAIKKEFNLNIWIYTGYYIEDLNEMQKEVLKYADILVDGPFIDSLTVDAKKFTGSNNQRIIDLNNYSFSRSDI